MHHFSWRSVFVNADYFASSSRYSTQSGTAWTGLDLDVNASRQTELVQRINRLVGGLNDIDQPLVSPDLELLARFLVDMRRTVHREFLNARRQRNRSGYLGSRTLRGLDDFESGDIEKAEVEALKANSYALSSGHGRSSLVFLIENRSQNLGRYLFEVGGLHRVGCTALGE